MTGKMHTNTLTSPDAVLPNDLQAACEWSDDLVNASGIEVREIPFVTVGGGIGSFALVDVLRIAGVSAEDIAVVGPFANAYESLKSLLVNSQIADSDRIRSGSADRMDNIWGWPGYGLAEAFRRKSPLLLMRLAAEPVLSEYYTPKASDVYESIDREAARISWSRMFIPGKAPLVRKRSEGGYFVVVVPPDSTGDVDDVSDSSVSDASVSDSSVSDSRAKIIRARYVHLAVGAAGLHTLPDLEAYRAGTGDLRQVVNVYEPHEHVYRALIEKPGSSVLVRGAASSAMEVIARLINDRDNHGSEVTIYHLIRHYVDRPKGSPMARIPGGNGFAYQSFTFTKGAYGGQLQNRWRSVDDDEERKRLLGMLASTAIPKRRRWLVPLARGKREGWYKVLVGSAAGLQKGENGRIIATIDHDAMGGGVDGGRNHSSEGQDSALAVDYVIDCTGVTVNLRDHGVMADLVDCGGAGLNSIGQLAVDRSFEVEGVRSGNGKVFTTGFSALGNPYVIPMYSFWGYQYCALAIADSLANEGFCSHITTRRSIGGWWRMVRNRTP
jgi:hypothetical protein